MEPQIDMSPEDLYAAIADHPLLGPVPKTVTDRAVRIAAWVLERVPYGEKVLELGAGGLHLASLLKDRYALLVTDVDRRIVDKVPPGYVTAVCKLPDDAAKFADGAFHTVIASDVLEHLYDKDLVYQSVKEMVRVARRYVVVSVGLTQHGYRSEHNGVIPLHRIVEPIGWWHDVLADNEHVLRVVSGEDTSAFFFCTKG